jgi:hypothetical protein
VHLNRRTTELTEIAMSLVCLWLMTPPLVEAYQHELFGFSMGKHSRVDVLRELWHVARDLEIEELKAIASQEHDAARRDGSPRNVANRLL